MSRVAKVEWTKGRSPSGTEEFTATRDPHQLVVWLQTGPGGRWWGGFSWVNRGATWCEVTTKARTSDEAKRLVIARSLMVEAEEDAKR